MTTEYIQLSAICYADKYSLRNNRNGIKGWKFLDDTQKEKRKTLERFVSKIFKKYFKHLIGYSFQKQFGMLGFDLNFFEVNCPVCGCAPRKYIDSYQGFNYTCGFKDQDHYNFTRKKAMVKTKKTFQSRYQVDNIFQDIRIRKNIAQKNIKNFGTPNPMKNLDIIQKAIDYNLANYGVKSTAQKHYKNKDKLTSEYIINNFKPNTDEFDVKGIASFYGCHRVSAYKILERFKLNFRKQLGGFNQQSPALLYYFIDLQTGYYKIGITNRTINERFGKLVDTRIRIISIEKFQKGSDAKKKEQYIINKYKEFNIRNNSWSDIYKGHNEFFSKDILNFDNYSFIQLEQLL